MADGSKGHLPATWMCRYPRLPPLKKTKPHPEQRMRLSINKCTGVVPGACFALERVTWLRTVLLEKALQGFFNFFLIGGSQGLMPPQGRLLCRLRSRQTLGKRVHRARGYRDPFLRARR